MAQDKHHYPVVVSENGLGPYQQAIHVGRHRLLADCLLYTSRCV